MDHLMDIPLPSRKTSPRHPSARPVALDPDFDQALLRLAAARLRYEDVARHGGSFAARLDALDDLNRLRTEMAGLRIGAGLEW